MSYPPIFKTVCKSWGLFNKKAEYIPASLEIMAMLPVYIL
jgi:hypothetical protein